MEIKDRFKEIRNTSNLTREKFANKIGITPYKVRDIESGKQRLTADIILKLEEVFSVNSRWQITSKGSMLLQNDKDSLNTKICDEIKNFSKKELQRLDFKIQDMLLDREK